MRLRLVETSALSLPARSWWLEPLPGGFVLANGSTLTIIDGRAAPDLKIAAQLEVACSLVSVTWPFLVAHDDQGTVVYDLTTMASPRVVGSFPRVKGLASQPAFGVQDARALATTRGGLGELTPAGVSQLFDTGKSFSAFPTGLFIGDSIVCVAAYAVGLFVLERQGVGFVERKRLLKENTPTLGQWITRDALLLLVGDDHVSVLDVRAPAFGSRSKALRVRGETLSSVFVRGEQAFVCGVGRSATVTRVDLSAPLAPRQGGTVSISNESESSWACSVALLEQFLVIPATDESGVTTLDVLELAE